MESRCCQIENTGNTFKAKAGKKDYPDTLIVTMVRSQKLYKMDRQTLINREGERYAPHKQKEKTSSAPLFGRG